MSLRLEMLQVARLAPKVLGDAAGLVREFLLRQQHTDGGFKNRSGVSDLYYTVFGLDALLTLKLERPSLTQEQSHSLSAYLSSFGEGEQLDFVHLCCLARAWTAASAHGSVAPLSRASRENLGRGLERFRSDDGGFCQERSARFGTAYGAFLGLGAYQDLDLELANPPSLAQSLEFLRTPDGAWSNERGSQVGATNPTAAALAVLRNLGRPVETSAGDWLLARCHAQGGFVAAPGVPMPDLLSTATALHALAGLQVSLADVKEKCLDYVDSLWTNEGGFHGHWSEAELDAEYTFYGLLALGHLSL